MTLGRHDELSIGQATAAQRVLIAFLDDLLEDRWRFRHVQEVLLDVSCTIRDAHRRRASHLALGLEPEIILDSFQDDARLDGRWRERVLGPCRQRVSRWLRVASERVVGGKADADASDR